MTTPEAAGDWSEQEASARELRSRMMNEAVLVLGCLDEHVPHLLEPIRAAFELRSIAPLRSAIADAYRLALSWMQVDPHQAGRLESYAGRKGIPRPDRGWVVGEAFDSAQEVVDKFERAEGRFEGLDPVDATPVYSSIWKWMDNRVWAQVTKYWKDSGRGPTNGIRQNPDKPEHRHERPKPAPGHAWDEYGAKIPVTGSPGEAPPSVPTEIGQTGHPGPTPNDAVPAELTGAPGMMDALRELVERALANVTADLFSPDLLARKNGAARATQQRRVLASVSFFLTRIIAEKGDRNPALNDPSASAAHAAECARAVLRAEPDMMQEVMDTALKRGLRSDVLYATAGAIRLGLRSTPAEPDDPSVSWMRTHLTDLEFALEIAQVYPVTILLAYRISTNEVGLNRFKALSDWLEELLDWLVVETSPEQQSAAVAPALEWLETASAAGVQSPLGKARQVVDVAGQKADEALELLGIAERLREIAKGTDR